MRAVNWIVASGIVLFAASAWAGDFKVYAGAKLDEKLTEEAVAMSAGAPGGDDWKVAIYTTKDAFEKVCAFYKEIGNEYDMPSSPKSMKLPSGTELKTSYFLFGEAKDLQSASSWIKVQTPLITHKQVQVLTPGMRQSDTGEVPGVTTIMHMARK